MDAERDAFRLALAEKARVSLPEAGGRIDAAVKSVLAGDVELLADGTAQVASSTNPLVRYAVNGSCTCKDVGQAPSHLCKHRLSMIFVRRVQAALTSSLPRASLTSDTADATSTLLEGKNGRSSPGVPPEFLVWIQGKPFVKFAGLLTMAHAHGLTELQEQWTFNDETLSLAHAVALFADGRRFAGSGDATPSNVTKKVAPHFRRVALTRAKSRALRDALNIDMIAVEELGEE